MSLETRSAIMRAVKDRGVRSAEMRLRGVMISKGVRGWRMYARDLPGKPDFVFSEKKVVIFVDGCFWHGCPKCYRRPYSRQDYWDKKLQYNILRDRRNRATLRRKGWHTMRVWEREIKSHPKRVYTKIIAMLGD